MAGLSLINSGPLRQDKQQKANLDEIGPGDFQTCKDFAVKQFNLVKRKVIILNKGITIAERIFFCSLRQANIFF